MINRYPKSQNKSLRAWSSADEYLINYLNENNLNKKNTSIYNDSFGYLTVNCQANSTEVVCNLKSQEKAIVFNLKNNSKGISNYSFSSPLENKGLKSELGILKVPKSIDLFHLYLKHFTENCTDEATLICGFMTRNFTKQIVEIASQYFEETEQSLAYKKARLLILKKVKKTEKKDLINQIAFKNESFLQYYGVFSSKRIDFATQFLIENICIPENSKTILDLASGNGILAKKTQGLTQESNIHLIDDSFLAIESSKLNLKGKNIHFHHNNSLENLENDFFDYVISNPPFHLEHEIDLSLPLGLFEQVKRVLKPEGKFQLVANRHLNYKTHLEKIFKLVTESAKNDKFIIYTCSKKIT